MQDYFNVVAQVLRAELRAVAADQQALADALSPAVLAADPALVTRLQAFDALGQRLEMLARVVDELEQGGGTVDDARADALLARIELSAVRDAFARRLGREASMSGDGDVELF